MKKGKRPPKFKIPAFDDAILQSDDDDERVWVYHTRPNQEFAFEQSCKENGIVCYLPVRRAISIHNVVHKDTPYSYSKEVLRPMFSTYLFVKASADAMQAIRDFRITARYVPLSYGQDKLLDEIRTIRTLEKIGFDQELEVHKDIPQGGYFLITSGVWTGVKGYLVNKDGIDKWTVRIEFCQRSVTTTIDPTQFKMERAED